MKYFNMDEFLKSDTAVRLGIKNIATPYQLNNMTETVNCLLDPLREAWGMYCAQHNLGNPGIRINSGIRGEALNRAIGGSPTSAHCHGFAVDMAPMNGRMLEFKNFIVGWLRNKIFDQFISEEENNMGVPRWIHLGYKNGAGAQRRQFLKMINNKYYPL